jgi:[ribosomal protein S5]-alanine N-acetyltransferase
MYQIFETERLIIQPTTEVDAVFLFELMNTPKWIKNIGDRNVKSIEDAKVYVRNKITPQLERLGYSSYTVIRQSDGVKLGVCGLYDRDGVDGIDIGFAFLPQFEKKGYAFEAAGELKNKAITVFSINQISAITTIDNIESQSLLEKIGFGFVRLTKIPHDDEELLLYRFLSL